MEIILRQGTPADGQTCGEICYEGFKSIAERHNFPLDFPNPEIATITVSSMLSHPGFYGVVAEIGGKIVGSNFLDERSPIAGIGPISVDPSTQDRGVGKRLMKAVLGRAAERKFPGVRLVQAAYHTRSLSLYTKLGFDSRESLSTLQGKPIKAEIAGLHVRKARESDLEACNRLCAHVHGHDRGGELHDAVQRGIASVVERDGRITGYTTGVAFFAHSIGESNDDLKALIAAAESFDGPGFVVPNRNGELMRWCLDRGLRVVQIMTLMTIGLYNEPHGAYLPSILY